MSKVSQIFNRLSLDRSGFVMIVIAALLIELTAALQYYFSYRALNTEVRALAQKELEIVNANVTNHLMEVKVSAKSISYHIQDHLEDPDSIYHILDELLLACPAITNCAVAFEPDYFEDFGRWFEPLAQRNADGTITHIQAGGEKHDYHKFPFYTMTMACDSNYWSEPYLSEVGNEMLVTSFSLVLRDDEDQKVGVLCADVPLNWLSEMANSRHVFPSSYIMILSRAGQLMVYPVDPTKTAYNKVRTSNADRDESVKVLKRNMMAGKSGEMEVLTPKGDERMVFYTQTEDNIGWSIAVVCNKDEVYSDLNKVHLYVFLLMLAGVALLSFIFWRARQTQRRMLAIDAANERMGSELRVASDIQQSMLPKTFAPFALHPDIDIYASLTPAKEVGGDLYDYYIRDEKLFFCIGDVSGKGVPASLVMSEVRSLFRSFTMHETRLDRIMGLMNKAGSSNNEQLMFVTYFLGILDLPTGRLRYCNAGHDAPLIIDRDGARMLDVTPNLPLGVDVSMQYTAQETILDSGSTLFLYTDGLTEAMDATHHQFTSDRMMEVASQIGKQGETRAQTIVQQMSEAVRSFVDVAQQSDDLAMLTISYVQPDNTCVLDDSITIVNDLKAMDRVTAWFESMTSRLNMPENAVQQLRLALEEAIVNVILYAYPTGTQGEIEVVAKASADRLQLRITDSGTAFDPTMRETADTNLDAEDRPIGGLGILLVRQNTDAVNYERVGNKNIFTLFKNL